jgi:NSS family neurotransmitter:Na+ symporter
MITYAAYSAKDVDLVQAAIVTLVSDTAISFLAGLAIFPIVFAERFDPSSGPGLMFVTVPLAFACMPFGGVAAFLFFVLLSIAALASAMSMLKMPVAFLRSLVAAARRPDLWNSMLDFGVGKGILFQLVGELVSTRRNAGVRERHLIRVVG